jgi:putative tricarboxylic transport membrane protein
VKDRLNSATLSGLLFLLCGLAFFLGGRTLPMGTAQRMGPGWFPTAVSVALIGIGLIIVTKGVLDRSEARAPLVWRPLLTVSAALALFVLLLPGLGLVLAVMALVVISAYAHPPVPLARMLAYGFAMGIFCALVFVKLLGLQMPILGAWLTLLTGA